MLREQAQPIIFDNIARCTPNWGNRTTHSGIAGTQFGLRNTLRHHPQFATHSPCQVSSLVYTRFMTSATPGPIPIVRAGDNSSNGGVHDGTPLARTGNPGSYLGISAGLSGSSSFREAMAVSFGKDVADLLEYSKGRFGSSTDSDATVARPSSVRLESTFCRNFTCCGKDLDDLHDLLQHYEEHHVRFEDDDASRMITDEEMDDASMSDSSASQPSSASNPLGASAGMKSSQDVSMDEDMPTGRPRPLLPTASSSTLMVSTTNEDLDHPSAFDTAVMCSPSSRGKKRAYGQQSTGSSSNPLFRALLENGGRHPLSMSGTYASPFSSPSSSRAGTPSIDSDNEMMFASAVQPPIFSNLSMRTNSNDDQLPSCAPPNLFFPSANVSSMQRPTKRERFGSMPTTNGTPSTPSTPCSSILQVPAADNGASEHRPYKCPAPGCDKAYKQMNGLKYHRLHGHCNQNLRNVNNCISTPPAMNGSSDNMAKMSQAPSPASNGPNGIAAPSAQSSDSSTNSSGVHLGVNTAAAHNFGTDSPQTDGTVSGASTPAQCMFPSLSYASPMQSPSSSSRQDSASKAASNAQSDKAYVCQVGNCDKRYKNLNGLRYHYLHSGSHGLLGLQLLHANGGGASAKADSVSGRPPVSTETLSREQIVQAAAAAQALLNQQGADCNKGPNGNTNPNLTAAAFLSSVGNNNSISMANTESM